MAQPLGTPYSYFADANGVPLAGGKIYTYQAGTTTPLATYTDAGGLTPAANPVILDSAGRATIWLSGTYKIVVKDSLNNTLVTTDNITALGNSGDMMKATYDQAAINEQLVGLTAVQTLTNKSLTAPTLSSPLADKITFSSTSGIIGTVTNDNAAAGSVGEYINSNVVSGSPVALVTATAKTVTSISLTAGDWDLSGNICFGGAPTGFTYCLGGISTTTNVLPDSSIIASSAPNPFNLVDAGFAIPVIRASIASTTVYYLIGKASFTGGTLNAYGLIAARRIR